ncbi:MAG: Clp protease ClpP [Collinsella sp.]
MQRYEGETTAYVDGIAASAASYIAVMADKVIMSDFAQLMIHDAWTYTSGNAAELLVSAERLEAVDGTIASIIAARSGMDVEDVRAAMDAETWYDAQAAVDVGLADEIVQTEQRVAALHRPGNAGPLQARPQGGNRGAFGPEGREPTKSHAANSMQENEGAASSCWKQGLPDKGVGHGNPQFQAALGGAQPPRRGAAQGCRR